MNKTLLVCALIAAYIVFKTARDQGALGDPEDQTGSMLDQLPGFDDLAYMAEDAMNPVDETTAANNTAAFLATIRAAEGTASDEGYRALFGWRPGNGKVFNSFLTHPRLFFNYTNKVGTTIRTSAAGAYQITATTFDALVAKYGFSDFTPATQDQMAITLIQERGALPDVQAGRFQMALDKVRKIWASLPGSNSDQPERNLAFVQNAYIQAGGTLA
jgi:lysozyme